MQCLGVYFIIGNRLGNGAAGKLNGPLGAGTADQKCVCHILILLVHLCNMFKIIISCHNGLTVSPNPLQCIAGGPIEMMTCDKDNSAVHEITSGRL